MGQTPKALRMTILVADQWLAHPEVLALAEKGHTIQAAPPADLNQAPWAWNWGDEMWDLLDVALKGARAKKREEKNGKAA